LLKIWLALWRNVLLHLRYLILLGVEMWWLALGSLLGAFSALLGHWQSPLASCVKIGGVAVFMIGLLGWLISSGLMFGQSGDGWSGSVW
jgi:hypothetical protein